MTSYTPEQLEQRAKLFEKVGILDIAEMLRAYAATLKAAQGRVTDAETYGRRTIDELAALSAEPAAQGEEFDPRKWVRHMADVLEAGGDLFKVDADLARLGAAICAITAPPAQPAERVPEGWVLVPREPTDGMIEAGRSAVTARDCSGPNQGPADHYRAAGISRDGIPDSLFEGKGKMDKAWGAELVYAAMLAASPAPSPARVDGGEG